MRTILNLVIVAIGIGAFTISSVANAASLLAIDFGRNVGNDPGTPSSVQSGFSGMAGDFPLGPNSPPPSLSAVFGAFTVTVSGDPYQGTDYSRIGFEDTAAAAAGIDPSIRNLYEDAMINNLDTNVGAGLNLSIQGVAPNTQYLLKLWSFNAENTIYPTPTQFGPLAGSNTLGTSGTVVQFATPLPTTLNDYSTTIIVSSTTSTLDIHAASFQSTNGDAYGGTRINAFELSAVPEPSALLLGMVGLVCAAGGCCPPTRHHE